LQKTKIEKEKGRQR